MAEERVRFQIRVLPETDAKIKAAMQLENCQSQNEFIEKAVRFYCDYLTAGDCTSILPPIYLSALQGTIQNTENHICRLLFKLAVELNMMMNVLASELDTRPETLERMRGRCIQEVKKKQRLYHIWGCGQLPERRRMIWSGPLTMRKCSRKCMRSGMNMPVA